MRLHVLKKSCPFYAWPFLQFWMFSDHFRNALNNKYKTKVCSTCFFSSFKVLFMHYRSSTTFFNTSFGTFFNTELLKANIFLHKTLKANILKALSIYLTIFRRLFFYTFSNFQTLNIAKVVYFSYVKIWVTLNTHTLWCIRRWRIQPTNELFKQANSTNQCGLIDLIIQDTQPKTLKVSLTHSWVNQLKSQSNLNQIFLVIF